MQSIPLGYRSDQLLAKRIHPVQRSIAFVLSSNPNITILKDNGSECPPRHPEPPSSETDEQEDDGLQGENDPAIQICSSQFISLLKGGEGKGFLVSAFRCF